MSPGAGLEALGWDEGWAEAAAAHSGEPGRVVVARRIGWDVVTASGRRYVTSVRHIGDRFEAPATGDWVMVVDAQPDPVVDAVLPRRTALVRRDPSDRAQPQVLAANADVVAVVLGADRPLNLRRVERAVAVAAGSGADVLVVVTKVDLERVRADALAAMAPVLHVSARTGEDLDALLDAVGTGTLVLLGESGVGKSTLANALVGEQIADTREVRAGDRKGRHTTTRRELHALPGGGQILDTPGIRALALWPDATDLTAAFPEIAGASASCRFADCAHVAEPGCAVRAQVADGTISAERLDAYHALVRELGATADALVGWRT